MNGIKWGYYGIAARIVAQLLVQVFFARLLGPNEFGQFSILIIILALGNLVVECGFGSALVQKKYISNEEIRFCYTWVMIISIFVASIIYMFSRDISNYFNDENLSWLIRGGSIIFILQATSIVPLSIMRRDLKFKELQIVQFSTYVLGFIIVGCISGLLGFGIWSLFMASLTQSLTLSVYLNYKKKLKLKPKFTTKGTELLNFSLKVWLANFSNWVIENGDNFIVSKYFTTSLFGAYAISYNLVRTPANHLVSVLQTVMFSTTSIIQENIKQLKIIFLASLSGVSILAIPIFSIIAFFPEIVIEYSDTAT